MYKNIARRLSVALHISRNKGANLQTLAELEIGKPYHEEDLHRSSAGDRKFRRDCKVLRSLGLDLKFDQTEKQYEANFETLKCPDYELDRELCQEIIHWAYRKAYFDTNPHNIAAAIAASKICFPYAQTWVEELHHLFPTQPVEKPIARHSRAVGAFFFIVAYTAANGPVPVEHLRSVLFLNSKREDATFDLLMDALLFLGEDNLEPHQVVDTTRLDDNTVDTENDMGIDAPSRITMGEWSALYAVSQMEQEPVIRSRYKALAQYVRDYTEKLYPECPFPDPINTGGAKEG